MARTQTRLGFVRRGTRGVACPLQGCHVLVTCWSRADHVLVTCWSRADCGPQAATACGAGRCRDGILAAPVSFPRQGCAAYLLVEDDSDELLRHGRRVGPHRPQVRHRRAADLHPAQSQCNGPGHVQRALWSRSAARRFGWHRCISWKDCRIDACWKAGRIRVDADRAVESGSRIRVDASTACGRIRQHGQVPRHPTRTRARTHARALCTGRGTQGRGAGG